jgi:hypothetical protein
MLKSHELIGFMSPTLANEIIAFTFDEEKPLRTAIIQAVAEARHLRPAFVQRKPRSEQATMILSTLSRPNLDTAAGTLLRTWLVKKQAAMLTDFLDALDIPNEKGVVEDLPPTVADEKLKAAVDLLLSKHSRETVVVYLNAFYDMNGPGDPKGPPFWPNLKQMLETEPRLQLLT